MQAIRDLAEIYRFRELTVALGMREVRVRYKRTFLGIAWALILPLALTAVFTFVFARVATIDTNGIPYPVFALAGLTPWQFHVNLVNQGSRCLIDRRDLLTKVYFAREVLPLSVVVSSVVDFTVAMTVVVGVMAWYQVIPSSGIFMLPVVFLVQVAFGLGFIFVVSAMNLFYRDVQYILQVVITLWMFASSVVYPIPMDGWLQWLVYLNPMTPILDAWRQVLLGGDWMLPYTFWIATGISLVLLLVGWRWFRRVEGRFGELA